MDDSFENDLQGYYKARASATSTVKANDSKQDTSASEVATTPVATYLHPAGFIPLSDQPNFSHDPNTQLWYDASTQVYSYYDAASGTYVPISQSDGIVQGYHDQGYGNQALQHEHQYLEAPPESDATLRLRVISSDILPVGGIVSMDASGLSFGRDRPLAGQGKRLRLSELDISRFHASIFLNREWHQVTTKDTEQDSGTPQGDEGAQTSNGDLPSSQITQRDEEAEANFEQGATPDITDQPLLNAESSVDEYETKEGDGGADKGSELKEDASSMDAYTTKDESKDQEEGELDEDDDGDGTRLHATPLENKASEHESTQGEDVAAEAATTDSQYYSDYYAYHQQQYIQQQPIPTPTYEDAFQIFDCGSTHGTFLNGERLSPPKAASKPFTLKHLDQLRLGSTTFEIHAHEEGRVCADCQACDDNEIEVLDDRERSMASATSKPINNVDFLSQNKLTMEQQRIEEMNRLKKKWSAPPSSSTVRQQQQHRSKHGLSTESSSSPTAANGGRYVDRAAKRRLLNPDKSSPPSRLAQREVSSPEPQVVSGFHIPVGVQNKGYSMLSKMGWKEGTGLGAAKHGMVEPVQLKVAQQRAGLGSSPLPTQGAAAEQQQQARKETQGEIARRQARQRFAQLQ